MLISCKNYMICLKKNVLKNVGIYIYSMKNLKVRLFKKINEKKYYESNNISLRHVHRIQ